MSLEINKTPIEGDDPWLSSDEACDYLKVKRDWLYDRTVKGEIPHRKIGRLLRFRRSELDAWMEGYRR